MNKTSDVLIYQIPLVRTDKNTSKNTDNNLPSTNAKNEFSAGLYFCSLILKKDFNTIATKYVFNKNGKPSLESGECGFSISYTNDNVHYSYYFTFNQIINNFRHILYVYCWPRKLQFFCQFIKVGIVVCYSTYILHI